jgi:hypothetical protein
MNTPLTTSEKTMVKELLDHWVYGDNYRKNHFYTQHKKIYYKGNPIMIKGRTRQGQTAIVLYIHPEVKWQIRQEILDNIPYSLIYTTPIASKQEQSLIQTFQKWNKNNNRYNTRYITEFTELVEDTMNPNIRIIPEYYLNTLAYYKAPIENNSFNSLFLYTYLTYQQRYSPRATSAASKLNFSLVKTFIDQDIDLEQKHDDQILIECMIQDSYYHNALIQYLIDQRKIPLYPLHEDGRNLLFSARSRAIRHVLVKAGIDPTQKAQVPDDELTLRKIKREPIPLWHNKSAEEWWKLMDDL